MLSLFILINFNCSIFLQLSLWYFHIDRTLYSRLCNFQCKEEPMQVLNKKISNKLPKRLMHILVYTLHILVLKIHIVDRDLWIFLKALFSFLYIIKLTCWRSLYNRGINNYIIIFGLLRLLYLKLSWVVLKLHTLLISIALNIIVIIETSNILIVIISLILNIWSSVLVHRRIIIWLIGIYINSNSCIR